MTTNDVLVLAFISFLHLLCCTVLWALMNVQWCQGHIDCKGKRACNSKYKSFQFIVTPISDFSVHDSGVIVTKFVFIYCKEYYNEQCRSMHVSFFNTSTLMRRVPDPDSPRWAHMALYLQSREPSTPGRWMEDYSFLAAYKLKASVRVHKSYTNL